MDNCLKYCFSLMCTVIFSINAQHTIPLNQTYGNLVESELSEKKSSLISAIKPYYERDMQSFIEFDSLLTGAYGIEESENHSWLRQKLRYEHFIEIRNDDFVANIDPVMNFRQTREQNSGQTYWTNTRGFYIDGMLGKNVTFNTMFYENQATFPNYIDSVVRINSSVPGQGRRKDYKDSGHDYAWISGDIAFHLKRNIRISGGHGKQFVGDGYRSLLLSDYAFNYPYLKIAYRKNNFYYDYTIASFMHSPVRHTGGDVLIRKKTAVFHTLGWAPNKLFQFTVFESCMLNIPDSEGNKSIYPEMINPVIGVNAFSDRGKYVTGVNIKINPTGDIAFYGQFVIDNQLYESGYKPYGFQTGLKYFNTLNIDRLHTRIEYNRVMPYLYAAKDSFMSYTQYQEPLAHPLGANFDEIVGLAFYNYESLLIRAQVNYYRYGVDVTDNESNGQNLYEAIDTDSEVYWNAVFLQGDKRKVLYYDISLAYIVNPMTNLQITGGYSSRSVHSLDENQQGYFYLAIKTVLHNFYQDF